MPNSASSNKSFEKELKRIEERLALARKDPLDDITSSHHRDSVSSRIKDRERERERDRERDLDITSTSKPLISKPTTKIGNSYVPVDKPPNAIIDKSKLLRQVNNLVLLIGRK